MANFRLAVIWAGCVLGLASAAWAMDDRPLMFARTQFVIVPSVASGSDASAQAATLLPWQEQEDAPLPQQARPRAKGLLFDAQLRDATTVYTQGWFNLNGLQPGQALMLVLKPAAVAAIRPVNDFAAYDILLVSPDGKIFQILPSLILADLEEPYQTPKQVSAIIYLRGGSCEQLSIAPGDRVAHKFFRTPPKVLQAPGDALPQPVLKVRPREIREQETQELMHTIEEQQNSTIIH